MATTTPRGCDICWDEWADPEELPLCRDCAGNYLDTLETPQPCYLCGKPTKIKLAVCDRCKLNLRPGGAAKAAKEYAAYVKNHSDDPATLYLKSKGGEGTNVEDKSNL